MLCLPAVADFDHDGLADALMSLQELHEIQVKSRIYNAAPPPSDPPDILPDLGEWASAGSTLELDLVNLPAVAVYDTIEVTVWTEHFAGDDPQGIDPAGSLHTFPNVDGGTTHVSIPLQMWSSFGDSTGPLWDPKLESWGRIRLLKTNDAGHIVASSRDYLFDLGMPQVPDLVLDYPPQPNTLLWASVTRFGSDRSFGCRYLRSSSGRRIWTAVNIPHGIPPVAPGSGTMPDG